MAVAAEPHVHRSRLSAVPRWVWPVGLGAVAVAGCTLVRLVDPEGGSGIYPVCPFRAVTGVDCPGCGATRAVRGLLTGHPGVAADHNLLFVVLLPLLLVVYGVWLGRSLGYRMGSVRLPRWWLPALFTLIAVFWALRVLPGPFEWLASGRA